MMSEGETHTIKRDIEKQANNVENNPFFVYNCYYQPQLQFRNSNESFHYILKNNESIQIPQIGEGISVPSFQFNNHNIQTIVKPNVGQNNFADFIMNEQYKQQPVVIQRNRIIDGTQMLCDIEILMISRYFDIKIQVFCPPNSKYNLLEDRGLSNADWIKDRLQYRYKKPVIKESLNSLIDSIEIGFGIKQDLSGFEILEKQVHKSVKLEKPFIEFIGEIEKLFRTFIFTRF